MTSSHQIHARRVSLERLERECSHRSESKFWNYAKSDHSESQPLSCDQPITASTENSSIDTGELPPLPSGDSATIQRGKGDAVGEKLPSPIYSDEFAAVTIVGDIAVEDKLPSPSWESLSTISSESTECEPFDELSFGVRYLFSRPGRRESLLAIQLSPIAEETSELDPLEVEVPVFSYDMDEAIIDRRSALYAHSNGVPTNQHRRPSLCRDERRDSGITVRRPALVGEVTFSQEILTFSQNFRLPVKYLPF